ncbi:MAG: 5'-nucleotidase C-terminal domain-containing protein [Deltaproteobacteria bacterium]|nr:5'-nucleotidase C-terminal domain-containing protein [Deltaproteobacteria bacterium]
MISRIGKNILFLILAFTVLSFSSCSTLDSRQQQLSSFTLTVLHNNDGESHLLNAGKGLEDFGGVARFATMVKKLKAEAGECLYDLNCAVIMLSSGDNFLSGPEFDASLYRQGGHPYYDTIAMDLIGYNAIAVGNHEFDFGPVILAEFIRGFKSYAPFLSANLDFSNEPCLKKLVNDGLIKKSEIVKMNGELIGVIGITTPTLPFISSPRNVMIDNDIAGAVNGEVKKLTAQGVNKIILISHLQSIEYDLALAAYIRGVDIIVAGGGHELLSNKDGLMIPGDEDHVYGPYPILVKDADGKELPVVTTSGAYRYVGRLVAEFDDNGEVIEIDNSISGPVRVAGGCSKDSVEPDSEILQKVIEPVERYIETLSSQIIGKSEVPLDGRRVSVRTMETNMGDVIADSILWQATLLSSEFGIPGPDMAILNGGSIRNNAVIEPGEISILDSYDIMPFNSFVTIVYGVTSVQLKEILENCVSKAEFGEGGFPQIAGFSFLWDSNGIAQELDEKGGVITPGTRIRQIRLNNGIKIVHNGSVLDNAPGFNVATIDFLARGGNQYPFRDNGFVNLGLTYRAAMVNYIKQARGGLISERDYPECGTGRITEKGLRSN